MDRRDVLWGLSTLLFVGPGCLSGDSRTVRTPECAPDGYGTGLNLRNNHHDPATLEITVRTQNETEPILKETYELSSAEDRTIEDVFTDGVGYTVEATYNGTTVSREYSVDPDCNNAWYAIEVAIGRDGQLDIQMRMA